MRRLFIAVALALAVSTVNAEVKQQGNVFIEQAKPREAKPAQKTEFVYIDSKGVQHPIYVSSNGKAFVVLTSKKTGKQYKKYLPEVTSVINSNSKKKGNK